MHYFVLVFELDLLEIFFKFLQEIVCVNKMGHSFPRNSETIKILNWQSKLISYG